MIINFEELFMNSWPALHTKFYDGWVLRFANGYTKRANSVNPIYYSSLPLGEKIEYCEELYRKKNLPVIFKLTNDSLPKGIDTELEERGYLKLDETSVQLLEMKHYQSKRPDNLIVENQFSDSWSEDFKTCSCLQNQSDQVTPNEILKNIFGKSIVVRKTMNGKTIACGFGAIERDYIGIYDIIVDKNYRGKGFGQDIMDGILCNAFDCGIKTAYLSVVVGNIPAENLYQKLGFNEIYRYWYRKK